MAHQLKNVCNFPSDAEAFVIGQEVDYDHRSADGDSVESVQDNGQKGGGRDFWSENEIIALCGDHAVTAMTNAGIKPGQHVVYTADQVATWLTGTVGNKAPKHGLLIDPETFTVRYQGRTESIKEPLLFRLLARLSKRPGIFVDFHILRVEVWRNDETEDSTIGRTLRRLRTKLRSLRFTGISVAVRNHQARLMLD